MLPHTLTTAAALGVRAQGEEGSVSVSPAVNRMACYDETTTLHCYNQEFDVCHVSTLTNTLLRP